MPLSHTFVPLPQLAWQLPFAQTMPAAQLLPQAPQLLLSVASELQTPLQSCSPLLHVIAQCPRLQSSSAGQMVPQAPQLAGSFSMLAQMANAPVEQMVRPGPQLTAQEPAEQRLPLGQTLPHAPQLLESLSRLAQTKPPGPPSPGLFAQSVCEGRQLAAH